MSLLLSPGSSLESTFSAKEASALATPVNRLQNSKTLVFCRDFLTLSRAEGLTKEVIKEGANIWIFLVTKSISL